MLFCTDRGRALARRVSPERRDFHKRLTDLLSPEQIQALESAMVVLAERCMDGLEADTAKPRRPARRTRGA